LQKVLKAGDRARKLVKQILTFSRQSDQELIPVQVKPIVVEALKFIRASLPTSIEIRSDFGSNATVLADPTQIHQVLMNLCTNAAHAMQENGGLLTVSLRTLHYPGKNESGLSSDKRSQVDLAPGIYLEINVTDTGHGMPREVQNRIFDPFYTTKAAGKGTGMGLAVVHGIVKSHGGAILVNSAEGRGTTIQVLLPVHEPQRMEPRDKPGPLPTGNERILFVDDEEFQVDLGEQLLNRLGYSVVCHTRSRDALAAFKADPERFDLVITDMTMPEMTGDVLAQELIKIRSDLPVIVCTGFSEQLTPEKADALGIKGFLMKPVVMADMANMVRNILDRAMATRNA
jgi:CheY-like chemotaxis protein